MRRAITEHRARLHATRNLVIAAVCSVIAYVLCQLGPIDGRPILGYVATLLAVAATALVAPSFVTAITFALRGTLKRLFGAEGLIAGRSLVASLSRTSVVVTALATAIGMMISVGTMVGSFRETVQVWLNSQLQADIYLRAQGAATAGIYPPMSAQVPDIVAHTPGVAYIDVLHALEIHYEGARATLGGARTGVLRRHRTFRFLAGNGDDLAGRDRAIVTEPFADKHHVRLGDVLHLELGGKTANLTVTGIFYDYSSDRGLIYVDEGTLLKYLPDQPVTNVAAYLTPGADPAKVRRDIQTRLADFPLTIAPNEALRRGAVEVFDRTFTVTYALEAVAIVVAMLGAANSLLALVLDRRREIGLIRCLGAAAGQVRRMILAEAGLLGLLAGLLGLVLGMALSLVLIYVINKQSFGWTIQFHPPVLLLAGALLLVWAFTVLAGVYPARFAAKLEPAEVIHEE
jgi:putative ABC transport system permease protein